MRRVIIVRHGNTFDKGDVIRRVGSRTDLPLSNSGEAQALKLAEHFRDTTFDAALTSALNRTRQTAEAIMAGRAAPELQTDSRLIEIDYGPDEGQPETDVIARLGADAIAAWDADAQVPDGWHVAPEALRSYWKELLDESIGTTLIVTSNGIARFVLDVVQHDGAQRKLATGAYGIVDETEDGWVITAWNQRP